MRLIDADLLKDDMIKCLKPLKPEEEMIDSDVALMSTIMEIDEQPTAFDVDKVIEQIDGLKDVGLYDGFMVWNVLSDYELLRSYKEAFE